VSQTAPVRGWLVILYLQHLIADVGCVGAADMLLLTSASQLLSCAQAPKQNKSGDVFLTSLCRVCCDLQPKLSS
jgi:hypothetical protein